MNDKKDSKNKQKASPTRLALYCPKAHTILWSIAIVGVVADLWTKNWALNTQIETVREYIIGQWFFWTLAFNRGAAFSIASGQTAMLITFTLAALAFIFWLFATSKPGQTFTHIALGMIVGGALGNFHDRIFNESGAVVDFIGIDLGFWPLNPWPIFNIADSLLCVGVAILMICMLKSPKE